MARKTDTRDRLLDAATECVLADGPRALTLDAVAGRSGVSKGGLLYHFPSKDALVRGMVERMVAEFEAAMAAHAERDPIDAGRWSRAYLAATMTAQGKPADASGKLMAALLAAAENQPALLEPVQAAIRQWQERVEGDGLDPATASIIRLATDGIWFALVFGLPLPARPLLKQVLAALGGLASSEARPS